MSCYVNNLCYDLKKTIGSYINADCSKDKRDDIRRDRDTGNSGQRCSEQDPDQTLFCQRTWTVRALHEINDANFEQRLFANFI